MNSETFFYVRPWNLLYFNSLSKFLNFSNSIFFSDHKNCGDNNLYKTIEINFSKNSNYFSFLNENDIKEIILRDRMLRELNLKDSKKLISTFILTIEDIFLKNDFKRVISIDVDCYVSDIISRYCVKNKIPYYGYSLSLLENYLFLTNKGIAKISRKPSDVDLKNLKNYFEIKNIPSYMVSYKNYFNLLLKNYFRNFLKIFYFGSKLILSKNKLLHYHYFTTYYYAKKHFFNLSWVYLFSIQQSLKSISYKNKIIYIPLQFFPEHNCEYWTKKNDFISYQTSLIKLINKTPSYIKIFVKEHPAMIGKRDFDFYFNLNKFKNVVFINSKESQKDLINKSDLCLTHNGSILLESVYYNKKTIVLGNSPYFDKRFHFDINSFDEFSKLIKKQSIFDYSFSELDKDAFFKKYLSNLIYGNTSELSKDINDNNVKTLWNNLKKHIS
mgnify:CR=1 FL=1